MRKKWRAALLFLCCAVFLALRVHSIGSHSPVSSDSSISYTKDHHPWVKKQGIAHSPGVEADLKRIKHFCNALQDAAKQHDEPVPSEEKVTHLLMHTLTGLQKKVPFAFPEDLYNVLCIPESPQADAPFPYQVYQRLYLGQNTLNMPTYLDVRAFDVSEEEIPSIIDWHLSTLEGGKEAFQLITTPGAAIFLGKGKRNSRLIDPSHGFGLTGERGIYLSFQHCHGKLFVAYAECAWESFTELEPTFDACLSLAGRPLKEGVCMLLDTSL